MWCIVTYYALVIVAFALLLGTSGRVIEYILEKVSHRQLEEVAGADTPEETTKRRLEIGAIIGKCENILILVFLILEAYTAIALVVTAKTIVRKEEIEKNSMYFLAGTMINVSYSVLVGFVLKLILQRLAC
ncbi:MAG TPA: hypothetical protein VHK69_17815 [Chitinophagaceae bacterium]|jgi:hypothetical protein|nr:hypothetical protein [Chitinophagaceae bacterium]